jgi:alpha-glucosidase
MLGTVPILHPDAFQEQVDRMDECLHAYCLVVAFCAFVLTQTGYLSCHEHTAADLGRTLLDEVMAARRHLDPFAAPIRLGITIAFLLYGCHIGCGNQRQAYYFLREATTFYTADMLDQSADENHPSFSGKLFWLLLISERFIPPPPQPFISNLRHKS